MQCEAESDERYGLKISLVLFLQQQREVSVEENPGLSQVGEFLREFTFVTLEFYLLPSFCSHLRCKREQGLHHSGKAERFLRELPTLLQRNELNFHFHTAQETFDQEKDITFCSRVQSQSLIWAVGQMWSPQITPPPVTHTHIQCLQLRPSTQIVLGTTKHLRYTVQTMETNVAQGSVHTAGDVHFARSAALHVACVGGRYLSHIDVIFCSRVRS